MLDTKRGRLFARPQLSGHPSVRPGVVESILLLPPGVSPPGPIAIAVPLQVVRRGALPTTRSILAAAAWLSASLGVATVNFVLIFVFVYGAAHQPEGTPSPTVIDAPPFARDSPSSLASTTGVAGSSSGGSLISVRGTQPCKALQLPSHSSFQSAGGRVWH